MAADTVILDCAQLEAEGLAAVEEVARAGLAARRSGRRVALRNASAELVELICFLGLDGALRVEVKWQTE